MLWNVKVAKDNKIKKLTTEEFINRANIIHKNKFDYSKSIASGWAKKLLIICKKHGEFEQNLGDHLQGKQCAECSKDDRKNTWSNEEIEFLKNNYKTYGRKECAKKLNKTVIVTRSKARELNLTREQFPRPQHDHISSEQIGNMIRGAKERNLEFNITPDDIYNKFLNQNGKCALSGITIFLNKERKKTTASVDRIDSSKGYILSNIQIVHKDYNSLKSNFSDKDLFEMCKNVYFNLKERYE